MKTVPLHGKKAAGRVALVDDGDYDLVMQHRWNVHDPEPKPGRRRVGPYAVTNVRIDGRKRPLRMHCLIMGRTYIDHKDHDGLNNQRSNLRPATKAQNNLNVRPRNDCTSQYKGVYYRRARHLWNASVHLNGRRRNLGDFVSELEAAYVYDAAARELHGEFACPNFPDGPTQVMRDQWRAEREARTALVAREHLRTFNEGCVEWWASREPETFTCKFCGAEFQSRAVGKKFYCDSKCERKAGRLRRSEERRKREEEGRLF